MSDNPLITVTLPDTGVREFMPALTDDVAQRVRLIDWDMRSDLPADVAARVTMVVAGHYWGGKSRWMRLTSLPHLQAVQIPSAGFEHMLPFVPQGVTVCNGRGVQPAGTSEMAMTLILAAQRQLPRALASQAAGQWEWFHAAGLTDQRVLIVGAGDIATALAQRLAAFEAHVTLVGRTARPVPSGSALQACGVTHIHAVDQLPSLLTQADIVVVLVPGGDATRHLIDAQALAAMPDGALLVNLARGTVVDTDALVAQLTTGRLGAALDVTDPEPLPAGHPLWSCPGTLITPHLGGAVDAASPRYGALVARQITHLARGLALENQVTDQG